MELRPELMPPALNKALVARLAKLASSLDGARPELSQEALAEFNAEAGTALAFPDFQGIYGGQDHDSWVRKLLAEPYLRQLPDISRAELVELARRVMEAEGEEHEIDLWLEMLAVNIPDLQVSDLLFWPGEYFGNGDNARELTPEEVIDIALARAKGA